MKQKIKIVLNTVRNLVYDVKIVGKDRDNDMVKSKYFVEDDLVKILYYIYSFNDKLTGDEIARILCQPYPSIKGKLKLLNHIVKINKNNYPHTYTFQEDIEIIPLSKFLFEKLNNWDEFKEELEEQLRFHEQCETEDKNITLHMLIDYRKKAYGLKKRHKPKLDQLEQFESPK